MQERVSIASSADTSVDVSTGSGNREGWMVEEGEEEEEEEDMCSFVHILLVFEDEEEDEEDELVVVALVAVVTLVEEEDVVDLEFFCRVSFSLSFPLECGLFIIIDPTSARGGDVAFMEEEEEEEEGQDIAIASSNTSHDACMLIVEFFLLEDTLSIVSPTGGLIVVGSREDCIGWSSRSLLK